MSEFKQYRRTKLAEMRAVEFREVLSSRVSVSESDKEAGSPKLGDMVARNPKNHDDQWLVAAQYFSDNFDAIDLPPNSSCLVEIDVEIDWHSMEFAESRRVRITRILVVSDVILGDIYHIESTQPVVDDLGRSRALGEHDVYSKRKNRGLLSAEDEHALVSAAMEAQCAA